MKRIFDRSFHYVPSYQTDLRKTFERLRREQRTQNRDAALLPGEASENVLALPARRDAR